MTRQKQEKPVHGPREKLNGDGDSDPAGTSDQELADDIAKWIEEFSQGRIVVVRTRDPFHEYIASAVQRELCAADFVLCVFSKRTKSRQLMR